VPGKFSHRPKICLSVRRAVRFEPFTRRRHLSQNNIMMVCAEISAERKFGCDLQHFRYKATSRRSPDGSASR